MGFYGRHYTYAVNDYFQTINFKSTFTENSTPAFPATGTTLTGAKQLTATVPAQGVNFATGNKWIQFVVNTENADMNANNNDVAYGLTIFHKKAEGLVTDKLIDFSTAVMKDGDEPIKDGGNFILGYGKAITVNDLEFDEAGHAKGSQTGLIAYSLPKVLDSKAYEDAYKLQDKIQSVINNTEFKTELNNLVRDYPFSAAAVIEPMVTNTQSIADLHEEIHGDGDSKLGLIKYTNNIDTRLIEVEGQIDNDILPALNLIPGLGKPGIEINQTESDTLVYDSFVSNIVYKAGNKGTILNKYDLRSLTDYVKEDFKDASYAPNVYYKETSPGSKVYELATEAAADPNTIYYNKVWGHTIKDTNHVYGNYALASGYGTRALGNYSQASNGYYTGAETYPTTAYGVSSHAEGRSDLRVQRLTMGEATDVATKKINYTADFGGLWANAPYGQTRKEGTIFVGLDVETTGAGGEPISVYKIYPATMSGSFITVQSPDTDKLIGGSEKFYEVYSSLAYGDASHIEGSGTIAQGYAAHAEGNASMALGDYSHAEGDYTIASGSGAHSEGSQAKSNGNYSHAEGFQTFATNEASHAEGHKTNSSAKGAHAEGIETAASEEGAHSEGMNTQATGKGAHAEGKNTIAQGAYSHAEGGVYGDAANLAKGESSHVEGGGCTAEGQYSHAGGIVSTATSSASFASGLGVRSSHLQGSAAFGRWNKRYDDLNDRAPIFAIGDGNGESDREEDPEHRSDALMVWPRTDAGPGELEVTGNLTVGNNLRIKGNNGKYYKLVINDSGTLVAALDE